MELQKVMAALAGGEAKVVDVTALKTDRRSGRPTATDVETQRQVALG